MERIIEDIIVKVEHTPNRIKYADGTTELFDYNKTWPKRLDWNPYSDVLIPGRPTRYLVEFNSVEVNETGLKTGYTNKWWGDTEPPEVLDYVKDLNRYLEKLALWPHQEIKDFRWQSS